MNDRRQARQCRFPPPQSATAEPSPELARPSFFHDRDTQELCLRLPARAEADLFRKSRATNFESSGNVADHAASHFGATGRVCLHPASSLRGVNVFVSRISEALRRAFEVPAPNRKPAMVRWSDRARLRPRHRTRRSDELGSLSRQWKHGGRLYPVSLEAELRCEILSHDQSGRTGPPLLRSEEHTSELQSPDHLVCRLLLVKKKT